MKMLLPIMAVTVLMGCSGTDRYLDDNYPGIDAVKHSHNGFPYQIRDNPNRKSLTVFAVPTSERTNITFNGLSFVPDMPAPPILEAAGQDYLTKRSKGSCAISKGYPIGSPYLRYEFFYGCGDKSGRNKNVEFKKNQIGLVKDEPKPDSVCERESKIDFSRDRREIEDVLRDALNQEHTHVHQFHEFKAIKKRKLNCGSVDLDVRYLVDMQGATIFGMEDMSRRAVLLKQHGKYKIERLWDPDKRR